FSYKQRTKTNLDNTRQTIETFKPDVIFIHIMWNLSRGVAWMAEQLCPGRVVYYIADHWPYMPDPHQAYWRDQANNPILNLLKQSVAPLPLKMIERDQKTFQLKFQHVLCVSNALKESLQQNTDINPSAMHVVYNGIDTKRFIDARKAANNQPQATALSLLYAGSLVWHKGVHTTIEAMAVLVNRFKLENIHLTLVGSGHPDYEAHLKSLVEENRLTSFVHFKGRVPREEMPELLPQFDVLIFPSTYEEPLARMTQEAMASDLVVVGTTTGGTKEILIEGQTGLTFPPEDADMLAEQIKRLIDHPRLRTQLIDNARTKVINEFDISRMITEIEWHLSQAAEIIPAAVNS
ncbi:MAG: glycosyltransferase family 4 protein, partial [Anaerolineae bacterium]|nr:glycosyltransferase family 4 protein [Anaerolineae bacterium]